MQLPQELQERLEEAVEQTLLASDLVQDILERIGYAGFDIELNVWARTTSTPVQAPAESDPQLNLFRPGATESVTLDWMPTEEDVDFLREMGVSEQFYAPPRVDKPNGQPDE